MFHFSVRQPGPEADPLKAPSVVTVAQLADFDEVIDVRSPSEFREDHVPGAVNCPVLDDAERAQVGTMYKQVSSFDAKKIGAALVARNIARHLETRFKDRPRNWKPLIYCWRGGKRSGAMAHIFSEVGWAAAQLEGGYKAYRRAVVADLASLPREFRWRVVCGPTGCGKSRLLRALAGSGAQVLDLEALAAHRGSVLGDLPGTPQPAQKMFESRIWWSLRTLQRERPVYVEAESRKIGGLRVPEALIDAMWKSECVRLEADIPVRVALLKEEYVHFLEDRPAFHARLEMLKGLYGAEVIGRWNAMADAGAWDELVTELLLQHYDPAYTRSTLSHYPRYPEARVLRVNAGRDEVFADLARSLLAGNA
ncbi:MAG: tRNA 2-selenouridine(34) synthase MnmH [Betaproteobacteria bacterium]|nr:tRNA 2-selenouridine(34) synthase MnmH [Betaproteobacteria bacterium]